MSQTRHWPLSRKSNGVCSVCRATRQLHLKDGTVHKHGPRDNLCPGSHKPPVGVVSQQSSPSPPDASVTVASPVANNDLSGSSAQTVLDPVTEWAPSGLFGGRLIALSKKTGGIRPIVVGFTLRRLVSKCTNSHFLARLAPSFSPTQLGVSIPGGCEAAIHSARRFLETMPKDNVVVKLDFSNAFNSLHRLDMLQAIVNTLSCFRSVIQPMLNHHFCFTVSIPFSHRRALSKATQLAHCFSVIRSSLCLPH